MGILYFFNHLIARAAMEDGRFPTRSMEDAFYNRYKSTDGSGILRFASIAAVAWFVFTAIGL